MLLNPGRYILSLPGSKHVLLLLFAVGFGVGVVVGAEEAEAAEAAEAHRRRTPSPFGVTAVSQRHLGPETGACCVADGCLPGTNRTFCEGLGGYYAGDSVGCDSDISNIPVCDVGSCCERADGQCKEAPAKECFDEGLKGSFVPGGNCSDDTTCSRGACCTQEVTTGCEDIVYKGRCEDVTFFGLNGTFLGEGTECGGEEDICQCQDGNEDICSTLDLPCGQQCTYDFQCDSKCCFTREQLKFKKPNDPRCPNEFPRGDDCNVTDVTCSYFWDCSCCGKCKYLTGCTCTQDGVWDCTPFIICRKVNGKCPQPVGQCTVSEWCECADQVQGEGGLLRDFLHCVDECTI